MKLPLTCFGAVAVLNLALGADPDTSSATPQPRMRLDPATRSAVVEPANREITSSANDAVVLERFVVRGRNLLRRNPQEPTGSFTPANGGHFLQRDLGGLRVEVGLWTTIDLFDEEARFKPQKTKFSFDFLRIRW
ncbi:MAG: hypothetical protein ABIZ04_13420 [Opitutus sp.]